MLVFQSNQELRPLVFEPLLVRLGMYQLFVVALSLFVVFPLAMLVYMAFHPLEPDRPLMAWLLGLPIILGILAIGMWWNYMAMDELSDLERPACVLLALMLTTLIIMIVANVVGVAESVMGFFYFGPIPLMFSGIAFMEIGRLIHRVLDRVSQRRSQN